MSFTRLVCVVGIYSSLKKKRSLNSDNRQLHQYQTKRTTEQILELQEIIENIDLKGYLYITNHCL